MSRSGRRRGTPGPPGISATEWLRSGHVPPFMKPPPCSVSSARQEGSGRMPLLLVLLAATPVLAVLRLATMPATAVRVARFARLHRLVLTPDNQPHIVAYLSHTRRWRAVGVLVAYLVSLVWMLPQQRIGFEVSPLLAGWLVGAAVAEVRHGPYRSVHRGA